MGEELATPEEVDSVIRDVATRAEELERVAGYISDEAKEALRLVSGSWELLVPQVVLDQFKEAVSRLDDAVSGAHRTWSDSQSAKHLMQ